MSTAVCALSFEGFIFCRIAIFGEFEFLDSWMLNQVVLKYSQMCRFV